MTQAGNKSSLPRTEVSQAKTGLACLKPLAEGAESTWAWEKRKLLTLYVGEGKAKDRYASACKFLTD